MSETTYVYQADDAELASWEANFTSRNGDGSGDSEANFQAAIEMAAACKAGGRFLDVGSGHGRIIGWLKPYASALVGIEPDVARCTSCALAFQGDQYIEIRNATTNDLVNSRRTGRFDLITVSMVLQHVSTGTGQNILNDVRRLLAENGVAIVSTTHFPHERFTYQIDQTPKDVAEFDRYADRSQNHDNGLPVRMFSKASFEASIEKAGLSVVTWQQFSYPHPEKADGLASMYYLAPGELRDCGISQFALVRHRHRPAPRPWWRRLLARLS